MTVSDGDQTIYLTGWQGETTGFRVGRESKRRVFEPIQKTLRQVRIELPGHWEQPTCRITPTFWTTCPEFRSAEIGRWMLQLGHKPWRKGKPPRYEARFVEMVDGTVTVRIVRWS